MPQSTIGRIEAGAMDPRVGTLSQLLRACGFDLEVEPLLGEGVDRSLLREALARGPAERLEYTAQAARAITELRTAFKPEMATRR